MANELITNGLRVTLAEIQAAIRATERRFRNLALDKASLTATPRLFDDPGTETPTVAIPRGSFNRTILETLRNSPYPLSVRTIVDRMAGDKVPDKRQMGLLVARGRNAIPRLSDKLAACRT